MDSGKRRSDRSQLRPEEWDALESEPSEEAGTFQRASAEKLARRRIVSVSGRYGKGSSSTTSSPQTPGANPFASIALSARPASSSSSSSVFPKPEAEKAPTTETVARCNAELVGFIRRSLETAPTSNWVEGIEAYLRKVDAEPLEPEPPRKKQKQKVVPPAQPEPGSFFSTTATTTTTSRPETKKTPLFAATTTPKQSDVPSFSFASGSSAKPTGLFSFGTTTTAPPTQTQQQQDDEDDAMPKEAPAQVLRADDGDETALFESRAAIRRLDPESKAWKDLGKGLARVMEHKSSKARRVVVRNDAGKVVLNFKLDPLMTFNKSKQGLTFQAIIDSTQGLNTFFLRTKLDLSPDLLQPAKFAQS